MDIHPKFATWLTAANIPVTDDTLRKWWTGLTTFDAKATDVVSLVQLAGEADADTVAASSFHAALRKQDAALLPSQNLAVAVMAMTKLHVMIEGNSALQEFATLLSAVRFPTFEKQPAYRRYLSLLAEQNLSTAARNRADLSSLVDRLGSEEEEEDGSGDEMKRVLAVTAEETNILWWIFGGRSRDTNTAFSEIASEVIPIVAAKELADLTTILPGHVAIPAFADKVCHSRREKPAQSLVVSTAIKKLPQPLIDEISSRWAKHTCLPVCRLTREIVTNTPAWSKTHKMQTTELSTLFYRECLVPRAWKKVST